MLYSSLAAATASVCTECSVAWKATVVLPTEDDDGDDEVNSGAESGGDSSNAGDGKISSSSRGGSSGGSSGGEKGLLSDGDWSSGEATLYVGGVRQHGTVQYPNQHRGGATYLDARIKFTKRPESVRVGASVLFRYSVVCHLIQPEKGRAHGGVCVRACVCARACVDGGGKNP